MKICRRIFWHQDFQTLCADNRLDDTSSNAISSMAFRQITLWRHWFKRRAMQWRFSTTEELYIFFQSHKYLERRHQVDVCKIRTRVVGIQAFRLISWPPQRTSKEVVCLETLVQFGHMHISPAGKFWFNFLQRQPILVYFQLQMVQSSNRSQKYIFGSDEWTLNWELEFLQNFLRSSLRFTNLTSVIDNRNTSR